MEKEKEFKPLLCHSENAATISNRAVYVGKDEQGLAVFKLSNGMKITTEYQDFLVEGETYEYKIS